MDGFSRCRDLYLVSKERDMFRRRSSHGSSEENKQLELTLGPPGASPKLHGYDQYNKTTCNDESLLSLGHGTIFKAPHKKISSLCDHTRPWPSSSAKFPSLKHCCSSTKMVKLQTRNNDTAEKQRFVAAVPESETSQSQKRTAPVVGWPPIRSFRKNIASSSTKPSPVSQNDNHGKGASLATQNITTQAGLFVKINMDGIPIGRKIDLNAYDDSYENLSAAVDKLFRGLLAVQTDYGTPRNLEEEEKPITGLLDGSGEYTLVYEDIEGGRVLVGDVPWRMFVSTVKRLRVLKTSDISSLSSEFPI
ncbi:unnamed protein product [Rhodiola kirilowii]